MMRKLIVLLSSLILLSAACGSGEDNVETDRGDEPVVAGLCTEDEPDCDDVGVIPGDETNDSTDSDEPVTQSGGALAGSGLTVPEALGTDATGVIAVRGFLFDDGSGLRLCEVLAESFPPQCGGAHLVIDGLTFGDVPNLPEAEDVTVTTEQNVTWTDSFVTLLGEFDGDHFTVSTTSA